MALSDYEFLKLSEKVKPLTWIVRLMDSGNGPTRYATAFAPQVDKYAVGIKENEVLLMTCAHILPKSKNNIMVRRIDDKDFGLNADIIYMKPTWDIALLVVRDVKHHMYTEFAEDGSISPCQTLLHVGHSVDMVWSVFVGRAVYQCLNNFVPFSRRETCKDYHSSSLNTTPDYRIIGDIWNEAYFGHDTSTKFTFEKNIHPSIPIIQCTGFSYKEGCSGGPVFNIEGQIVGMIIGAFDGGQIAIHLTLLKEFIKEFVLSTTQDSSEINERGKQPLGEGFDSKDARGFKRKGPSK